MQPTPPAPDTGPPKPRFAFSLGVTGHRAERLTADVLPAIEARIAVTVATIQAATLALAADAAEWYAPDPPDIRIVSALAEGADRLVAEAALMCGLALEAVLPFDRAVFRHDFSDAASVDRFDALLGRARSILELPGQRRDASAAYTLANAGIVAQTDVLIAVWDGRAAAGRGGTADVVFAAIDAGKPVIHIPLDPSRPVEMMWSGFEVSAIADHNLAHTPARAFSGDLLADTLQRLLLPPPVAAEHAALRAFYAERERLSHWRIEYPLLLAIAGIDRFKTSAWRKPAYRALTASYWADFNATTHRQANSAAFAELEAAYSWSDNLAGHFAQYFRSGHVINFVFSALAVVLALLGLYWHDLKAAFVFVELLLIATVVLNTRVGHEDEWQRRWLDYRHLAERLRPMRSLNLLAVANPPAIPASRRQQQGRWIDWYASALWRQLGIPTQKIDPASFPPLRDMVITHELSPEIAYHRRNAHRMELLDHRLHLFGTLMFATSVAFCIGFLMVYFSLDAATVARLAPLFTIATAALPAIGGATYGLRVHGDFSGSAARSGKTAAELSTIRSELEETATLDRTAALADAAAAIMLADLSEWRMTYEQRSLAIPG